MTTETPRFRLGFLTHVQGRVEIGIGSGSDEVEYAAFGKDAARKRELTSENLRVLRSAPANEEVRTPGFRIQPAAGDFGDRIWQGVFSEAGARHAAAAGSNLLINRAAYGFDAPTDEVQRPWVDAYLGAWDRTTGRGGGAAALPRVPRPPRRDRRGPAAGEGTARRDRPDHPVQPGRSGSRRGVACPRTHRDAGGAGSGLDALDRHPSRPHARRSMR
ncbi:LLM class flavin-dependent oxidoreductase [Streptomyces sp. NPDC060010]|uniref:LLM class flavin-dependent oxidoreductase n=1 Tax=Streptomyces sp. NPDC060010 TaxID=3347036 RepID=UPI0036CB5D42